MKITLFAIKKYLSKAIGLVTTSPNKVPNSIPMTNPTFINSNITTQFVTSTLQGPMPSPKFHVPYPLAKCPPSNYLQSSTPMPSMSFA
uniref:Ovule protein n=1 Tax=Panagrellus redivivus TaxID=6233 RepID=A0A7E4VFJ7_PANRE